MMTTNADQINADVQERDKEVAFSEFVMGFWRGTGCATADNPREQRIIYTSGTAPRSMHWSRDSWSVCSI
jgi:hypothetical protein